MAELTHVRGKKEHGTFSISGASPVVLQAADDYLFSLWIQVDSGGDDIRIGSSSLTTSNAPRLKAGGDVVLDQSHDATYIVAAAAGAATGTWLREKKQ